MMKKLVILLIAAAFALSLCACGTEQTSQKTDNIAMTEKSAELNFTNYDGNICFYMPEDVSVHIPASMPVLRVRPRVITAEHAKKIARAAFGDAAIYEYSAELSREEIEVLEQAQTQTVQLGIEDMKSALAAWKLARLCPKNPDDPYDWFSVYTPSSAKVSVQSMELGLSRVKLDDTDFLLIPTLSLRGQTTVYSEEGISFTSDSFAVCPEDLLIFDLRDGSLIAVKNP